MRRKAPLLAPALATAALAVALALSAGPTAATGNTIAHPGPPETTGGMYTSVQVDSAGRPVISHYDEATQDLIVLHCGDPACTSGNTQVTPDTSGDNVGRYSALILDQAANPIVTYYDNTHRLLKVLHCGDPACTSGNTIATPDTVAGVGQYSSLALTSDGNLVVSYFDGLHSDLKVAVCADAGCTGKSVINSPDTLDVVGLYTSLALDSSGYPVVSYYDATHGDLKVLHCGDRYCSAKNSITSPVTTGNVGQYNTLRLGADGYPIVTYYDSSAVDLKLLHCGDADCAAANTMVSLDTSAGAGEFASMTLDAAGRPVVAYHDPGNQTLKVLHCGNIDCTSGNTTAIPDQTGIASTDLGWYTSLALDPSGNPVVSYQDASAERLRVLHCSDPACLGEKPPPATRPGDANCDGSVNSIDAALLLQYGAGLLQSLSCQAAADVNGDGRVNALDAALVLQYVAGLIHSLPP